MLASFTAASGARGPGVRLELVPLVLDGDVVAAEVHRLDCLDLARPGDAASGDADAQLLVRTPPLAHVRQASLSLVNQLEKTLVAGGQTDCLRDRGVLGLGEGFSHVIGWRGP